MTVVDFFSSLVARRGRLPRSAEHLFGHGQDVGEELGQIAKEAERAAQGLTEADPGDPYRELLEGDVRWKGAVRVRRLIRRFHRHLGTAGVRWSQVGEKLQIAGEGHAIDVFVRTLRAYLASFGLAVEVLEGTGMLVSLQVFDKTLGMVRFPLAFASGLILFLAGHTTGELVFRAVEAGRRYATGAYVAVAVAVIGIGGFAIERIGVGRDRNLEATVLLNQAAAATTQAEQLTTRAQELETPLPRRRQPAVSRADLNKAKALNARAAALTAKADQLEQQAEKKRTLLFFWAIQLLGLAIGAVGGYFWARATDVRHAHAMRRHCRIAVAIRGRMISILEEHIGYAKVAHGGAWHRRNATAKRGVQHTPLELHAEEIVDRLLAEPPLLEDGFTGRKNGNGSSNGKVPESVNRELRRKRKSRQKGL